MPVSKTDTMAVHKDELIQLIEELKNECSVMIRTFSGDKDRLKNAIINAEEQVRFNAIFLLIFDVFSTIFYEIQQFSEAQEIPFLRVFSCFTSDPVLLDK